MKSICALLCALCACCPRPLWGLSAVIAVSGCLNPRPPVPPPPIDITVKLRPVVVTDHGLPAVNMPDLPPMLQGLNAAYKIASMQFEVRPPELWECPEAFVVDSEADWQKIVERGAYYSNERGELALFFVTRLTHFGGAIGVANFPPSHGIAIANLPGAWVTVHELGHAFGLPHVEPLRDCGQNACRSMAYCRATVPPCLTVFTDAEAYTMRQWAGVYPRRRVVTIAGKDASGREAKVTGKGDLVVCQP